MNPEPCTVAFLSASCWLKRIYDAFQFQTQIKFIYPFSIKVWNNLDEQTGSTKHVQPNWSLGRRKLRYMESTSANKWVNSISEEQRGDVWDGPERGKWKQTCSDRASHGDRMPHAPIWHSDIGLAWAWWMYKLKVRPTTASPDSGSGRCLHPGAVRCIWSHKCPLS